MHKCDMIFEVACEVFGHDPAAVKAHKGRDKQYGNVRQLTAALTAQHVKGLPRKALGEVIGLTDWGHARRAAAGGLLKMAESEYVLCNGVQRRFDDVATEVMAEVARRETTDVQEWYASDNI